MKYPLVSIIIVNWNGEAVLKDCLGSLEKISYPNWELVFVDNGSKDNSLKMIEEWKHENKVIIKNSINVGFAPANNQGYKKSKGDLILLLNNDTKVSKDFLTKLVEKILEDSFFGVVQPKIYLMEKPEYLDNCGSFITPTGLLKHIGFMEKDSEKYSQTKEVFSAKGACMLTRREIIEKVGLFDDSFGSYFEESDYCYRVLMAGYKVIFYPKSHIYHKLGFTSSKLSPVDVNYHSTKNRISSYIKNMSLNSIVKILIPHLAIILGLALYYGLKFQINKSSMMLNAVVWNIIHLPESLRKRARAQKHRVVSDREIFSSTMQQVSLSELISHFNKVEKNFKQ